jgi:hypothetical protein
MSDVLDSGLDAQVNDLSHEALATELISRGADAKFCNVKGYAVVCETTGRELSVNPAYYTARTKLKKLLAQPGAKPLGTYVSATLETPRKIVAIWHAGSQQEEEEGDQEEEEKTWKVMRLPEDVPEDAQLPLPPGKNEREWLSGKG